MGEKKKSVLAIPFWVSITNDSVQTPNIAYMLAATTGITISAANLSY